MTPFKFSKENITIAFYVIYSLVTYLLYEFFPGDAKTPNMGVVCLFMMIPISFIYAAVQVVRHFNTDKSYFKCLLIHTVAWFSIITFLTNLKK
ncbi:hypothetical protein OX284_016435 [Flavobacterium sp. SUN046]|uniref:hypothetical protein n=1 Tax=Flavobacterium sp. SUN046 TaxID=3002440 RepID=UPI002DB9AF92|nr:hypothetical protein [Flavobacterium sp. SUN046]MEC4051025.1 hypothetical protein [Flavobacterium sp. SUN046]